MSNNSKQMWDKEPNTVIYSKRQIKIQNNINGAFCLSNSKEGLVNLAMLPLIYS